MATLAEPRRLAQLPGYDTAPDVYETAPARPSSADNAQQRAGSTSADSNNDNRDSDDDNDDGSASSTQSDSDASSAPRQQQARGGGSVSRHRLYPARARAHFAASSRNLGTRGLDLSDRVDGRRRGYRVRGGGGERRDGETTGETERKAGRANGDEDEEGIEDEDDGDLDARIARLKREVDACRTLAERRRAQTPGGWRGDEDEMDALGRVLAGLDAAPAAPAWAVKARGEERRERMAAEDADGDGGEQQQGGGARALGKLADFDARLAALESALGTVGADGGGGGDHDASAPPLLPTLALLDQQFAALSSASSLAGLEALGARIAGLKADARSLAATSHAAATAQTTQQDDDNDDGDDDGEGAGADSATTARSQQPITQDDVRRLGELFALLPALSALPATVPPLIGRLKSLRTLHATAAGAAADLDALEQRQAEFASGLKAWRDGLEKVEEAVEEANAGNGRNGRMVKEWVDDLEARVKALGK